MPTVKPIMVAVLGSVTLLGCGGQVQSTSDGDTTLPPGTAVGAYVLSNVTLSDESAFGRAALPLAQSLCPDMPLAPWTATVSVDASGHGLMMLSSPCLTVHVPLEAATMRATSLTALVPAEQLVGAWSGDLAAANQSGGDSCDTAQLIGSRMRAAVDATVAIDGANQATALTLQLDYAARESASAPAATPPDPCAGRD